MSSSSAALASASASSSKDMASLRQARYCGADTQHDVVLDYLITRGYAATARTLIGTGRQAAGTGTGDAPMSSASPLKSESGSALGGADGGMDVDGVEVKGGGKGKERAMGNVVLDEAALVAMDQRQVIINYLLNGAIMRAVDALNTHFPAVLDDSAGAGTNGHSATTSRHGNGQGHGSASGNGHAATPSGGGSLNIASHASRRTSNGHGLAPTPWSGPSTHTHTHTHETRASNGSHSHSHTLPLPTPLSPDHALPVMHLSTTPAHVKLNLSIQAFIESFRQLAPASSPSTPSSSIGSLPGAGAGMSGSIHMSSSGMLAPKAGGGGVTLTNALTAAQGLHQEAKKLAAEDRAIYLDEIKDVGALLAYTEPETSILRGFLEQSRRIALAEQVNRAILRSEGRGVSSALEAYVRRTTALWSVMQDKGTGCVPPWTAADGQGKEQLAVFCKRTGKAGFSLRNFVAHD